MLVLVLVRVCALTTFTQCEPVASSPFVFDFEKWPLSKPVFQELIWQEMLYFHPEAAEAAPIPAVLPSARVLALQQVRSET